MLIMLPFKLSILMKFIVVCLLTDLKKNHTLKKNKRLTGQQKTNINPRGQDTNMGDQEARRDTEPVVRWRAETE